MKFNPIGWCHFTINFWWGCTEVSPACVHCYAREAQGLVEKAKNPAFLAASDEVFYVTAAGKAAATAGVNPVKVTKARRRYQKWREVREVCPDLTFREFLTTPAFEETRRYC